MGGVRNGDERRFTIGDAMILVASLAVGFAVMRSKLAGYTFTKPSPQSPLLWAIQYLTEPLMVALTPGWAVLRLRHPRPRLRTLLRRPGSVLGFASVAGVAVCLLFWMVAIAFRPPHPSGLWILFSSNSVGPMVLGGLSALLLGRRWRMGRGWVEWMGLGIGAYWVFWMVSEIGQSLLHHYLPSIG